MKIGDKVKVVFEDGSQAIGYVIGETPTLWKIDFEDNRPMGVSKVNASFYVINEDVNPNPSPNVRPTKKRNWKLIGIIAAVIVVVIILIVLI